MGEIAYKPFENVTPEQITKISKTDFISGLMSNGIMINKAGSTNTTSEVIYEVPEGKVFYLLSAVLGIRNTTAATLAGAAMYAPVTEDGYELLGLFSNNVLNSSKETAVSFQIPLKFNSGAMFDLVSASANLTVSGGITGYEISAGLVPSFT